MILGFMQSFPWKGEDKQPVPTYFREKILYGVGRALWITSRQIKKYPKIHTMRADPHNRWKPGMSIQMVYRGPKYSILDHFNKGMPELEKCLSVQKIEINYFSYESYKDKLCVIKIDNMEYCRCLISFHKGKVVGVIYPSWSSPGKIIQLSNNDGFNSELDFFRWFKNDFTGKIIQWTNFKY